MTKPKINPADFTQESVAAQIERFLAGGGKPQQIQDGAQADTLRSRKQVNEITAKNILGGKRGSETKKENFKRLQQKTKGRLQP